MTEELIKNTYMRLCRECDINKINVSVICREAGINRGTFYLHFSSIQELIEVLNRQFIELMVGVWNDYKFDKDNKHFLDKTFDNVRKNEDLCYFHFNCTDNGWMGSYFERVENMFVPQWIKHSSLTEKEAKLVVKFIVSGHCAILSDWINCGFEDMDIHRKMYEQITEHGIYSMLYNDTVEK